MDIDKFFDSYYLKFEKIITVSLTVAIMIVVAYATLLFFTILLVTIADANIFSQVIAWLNSDGRTIAQPIQRLQEGLFNIFGGFLLILLGLELINTIKTFAIENYIKIESIVAVAIIASTRHLITLDYHHAEVGTIFGIGFVVFSLILGYVLLKTKSFSLRSNTDNKSSVTLSPFDEATSIKPVPVESNKV
jgi:uncharacterized membrane protein (DUF373 family)